MPQPVDLAAFDSAPSGCRSWRVAHLSDLHVIGEQYGFRIESGRSGPRGNGRLGRLLARLAAIHAVDPLDHILITGDMTDAGRASEWAAFLDAMALHPELAARMVMLPGNHDVNIVDRANPARLDLPFSLNKRLRQLRTLSALAAIQGDRVHVVDADGKPSATLHQALAPHRDAIVALAAHGGLRRAAALRRLFDDLFPMILPPDTDDGLGIAILNSNAETHFSFTNALGLVSLEQTHRFESAAEAFSEGAVDRRLASPCGGISHAGESVLRTHRNGIDQRQLVRPQAGSVGGSRRRDAWPSPYRLDRHMRSAEDHLGAFTGNGCDR